MSQYVHRVWRWIFFEAVALVLVIVAARLWVGESWRHVITMCISLVLWTIAVEVVRRLHRRKATAPSR